MTAVIEKAYYSVSGVIAQMLLSFAVSVVVRGAEIE
jgi:hypothetical protein